MRKPALAVRSPLRARFLGIDMAHLGARRVVPFRDGVLVGITGSALILFVTAQAQPMPLTIGVLET